MNRPIPAAAGKSASWDTAEDLHPPSKFTLNLCYFLVIPLLIGGLIGWARVGSIAAAMPRELAFFYWGCISIFLWNAKWLAARALHHFGAISARPSLATLVIVACVAEACIRPLHRSVVLGTGQLLGVTDIPYTSAVPDSMAEIAAALVAHSPLIALWILVTAFYLRVIDFELFTSKKITVLVGDTPATTANASGATSSQRPATGFLQKLPDHPGPILAIRALDHYVETYLTDTRPRFIHRFEDAAREVGALGLVRVHRSFCVNPAFICSIETQGRRKFAVLTTGDRIPISPRHLSILRTELSSTI